MFRKHFGMLIRKRAGTTGMLSVVLVVVFVGLFVFYLMYIQTYMKHTNSVFYDTSMQTMKQVVMNIENELSQMASLSNYVAMNQTVNDALSRSASEQKFEEQYDEMQQLRDVLRACSYEEDAHSIQLYVDDDKFYAHEKEFFFPLEPFLLNASVQKLDFQPSFMSSNHLSSSIHNGTAQISCARRIRSFQKLNTTIGFVVINIDESKIASVLNAMNPTKENDIYLIDERGFIISSRNKEQIGSALLLDFTDAEQYSIGEFILNQKEYITFVKSIGTLNWHVVVRHRKEGLFFGGMPIGVTLFTYIILSLLMLASMLVILSFFIHRAAARVALLSCAFRGERIEERPETSAWLFREFDEAIMNAQKLVKAGYEQMQMQTKAQLQLLQLQINPHFLYNALDTVLWLVRINDTQKAEQMIDALARYLRLILNNGNDIVSLRDEIALASAYIDIQHISHGSFAVEFLVEPETEELLIPKLTLQPIIENAVLHGILLSDKAVGRIDVYCYLEDKTLYITVTDNGIGLSEEKLIKLDQNLNRTSAYGLYNVDQRIRLFSGVGDYGIRIESTQGVSTTVTLKISMRKT